MNVSFEISISFFMYIGALAYAIYQAYIYGQSECIFLKYCEKYFYFLLKKEKNNKSSNPIEFTTTGIDVPQNESSFSQGWSFIGRKRDDYDSEWESFVSNTKNYIFWYICHVLLSEIVRQLEPHVSVKTHTHTHPLLWIDFNMSSNHSSIILQRVCFVHATVGILFVFHTFKPIVANIMFVMVITYFIVMQMRKRYIWMLTIVWLGVLNMLKQSILEEWLSSMLSEKEVSDAMIALSWLLLRVTSFALDYCNARNEEPNKYSDGSDYFSTLNYLSYSFYLPVYLHGPPLIYERYGRMYAKNRLHRVEESLDRFRELIISLVRIGCVYVLNEFCMHFIYANVIIYNPDVRAN